MQSNDIEKIWALENKYPRIADVTLDGVKIWIALRSIIRYRLIYNRSTLNSIDNQTLLFREHYTRLLKLPNKMARALKCFLLDCTGVFKLFKKYDIIIISNSTEVREFDGLNIDKLFHGLIESNTNKKILYITNSKIIKYSENVTIVQLGLIYKLSHTFLRGGRFRPDDLNLLHEMEKNFHVNVVNDSEIYNLNRRRKLYSFFLRFFWTPEYVFVGCYSYYDFTIAAKQCKVPVIEFQHGVISKGHPGYMSMVKIPSDLCPDYFFIFGASYIPLMIGSIYSEVTFFPVGSYYLERTRLAPAERFRSFRDLELDSYDSLVSVPIDRFTEHEICTFINSVAELLPNFVFLIIPREPINHSVVKNNNVYVLNQFNFHEVIAFSDVNVASISTCVLDANFYGVPSIILNMENKASELFGSLIDRRFNFFIESVIEFVRDINLAIFIDKGEIMSNSIGLYQPNHIENLNLVLDNIYDRNY